MEVLEEMEEVWEKVVVLGAFLVVLKVVFLAGKEAQEDLAGLMEAVQNPKEKRYELCVAPVLKTLMI